MECFVQIEVTGETFKIYVRNFFHGAIDFAQGFQLSGIVQTFGRQPGGSALQDASGLDRVPDIGSTEFICCKAGMRQRFDQAFVFQSLESQAQRRTGNAELRGQGNLGDSLAGPQRAAEQHITQPQRSAGHLRGAVPECFCVTDCLRANYGSPHKCCSIKIPGDEIAPPALPGTLLPPSAPSDNRIIRTAGECWDLNNLSKIKN